MNPFVFLIDILFQLYATALLIRVLLQWVRADFYNPVSQFIVKITNPPVLPVRKIIPSLGGIDTATLLLAFLVIAIKIMLVYQIILPVPIVIMALGQTLVLIISIFMYSIIIQAVLSWVNPDPSNPAVSLLNSLTQPILKHFRNLIPPIGGMDISPMIAIIALMFVQYSVRYVFAMLGFSI
ncbi:Cell division integral membrane protein, YggT and half-length relatives [hydrothermal vent metagenome]|uniref:Cell division integral membrane protein, YggT and half-length relatives n=1 Tax=hydrothermal vent metagenome TaxID=652676 RepID=A0A3B0X0Z1_9ZZZZ